MLIPIKPLIIQTYFILCQKAKFSAFTHSRISEKSKEVIYLNGSGVVVLVLILGCYRLPLCDPCHCFKASSWSEAEDVVQTGIPRDLL
jgi:hypothetical protein